MPQPATLYDGATANRHDIAVAADGATLVLSGEGGWALSVDGALLSRVDDDRATLRLTRSDRPGWRLAIPHPVDPAILALVAPAPHYGRWVDRIGLMPALGAFAALAAGVVAIGYLAPAWIAPYVPSSWEANLGDSIVGDFGDNRCRDKNGEAALVALAERLEPGSTAPGPNQVKLAALDIDMFNAAALPGRHIVVFKGAIDETKNPDALAGILAHEIAHVRRRHVTQALIREMGIGALIRLFAGDIGANAQSVMSLSYTRAHEAEADRDAIAMLKRAGISPAPTGALFTQLAREEEQYSFGGPRVEFLESHPLSADRARRFTAAADPRATYRPALSPIQFAALRSACRAPKTPAKPRNR